VSFPRKRESKKEKESVFLLWVLACAAINLDSRLPGNTPGFPFLGGMTYWLEPAGREPNCFIRLITETE